MFKNAISGLEEQPVQQDPHAPGPQQGQAYRQQADECCHRLLGWFDDLLLHHHQHHHCQAQAARGGGGGGHGQVQLVVRVLQVAGSEEPERVAYREDGIFVAGMRASQKSQKTSFIYQIKNYRTIS